MVERSRHPLNHSMGSQQQLTMAMFEIKIVNLNIPPKECLAGKKGKHPL